MHLRARDKVLRATIQSLFTRGYSATALFNVAAEAGVSRGAAQHQFPTKIDLMLYVVSTVYADEKAIYQAKLLAIADPRQRLLAFPDIAWDVLSRPEGVAVLGLAREAVCQDACVWLCSGRLHAVMH